MGKKPEGKEAAVTGASKGIGSSIAKALPEEGASVVVNYASSKEDAEHGVADISSRSEGNFSILRRRSPRPRAPIPVT